MTENGEKVSLHVLFCPPTQRYSVYCQGGVKKPENSDILEAGIRDVTRTVIDLINCYGSEISPCPANTAATTPCTAKSDLLFR